ncbi:MAG: hypothetical protein J7K82_01740, partial [Thermoproteales archaeon]|nr:hypothetical protein [Thermoproteales archaeon]
IMKLLKDLDLLTDNVKTFVEKHSDNHNVIGIDEVLSMIKLINARLEAQEKRINALEHALESTLDILNEIEKNFLLGKRRGR